MGQVPIGSTELSLCRTPHGPASPFTQSSLGSLGENLPCARIRHAALGAFPTAAPKTT